MGRSLFGATYVAVLIAGSLLCPQASSVHLVSNQPTGTDNQNSSPVHYVPKMAAKLGMPQPQNRDTEEDPLTVALRQLIEHNKRQSVYIERLAALTPKLKTQEYPQTRKKPANAQTKTPQTTTNTQTINSTKSQTRPSQPTTKPNDPVVMRPAKPATENVNNSIPTKHPEPDIITNTPTQVTPSTSWAQNPSKLLHRSREHPVHRYVSYVPSTLPLLRLPVPSSGFYPQFVDPTSQGILRDIYPSYNVPHPYPLNAKPIFPEHKMQYQTSHHYPEVPQYLSSANAQHLYAPSPEFQNFSWQYPHFPEENPQQKNEYHIRSHARH